MVNLKELKITKQGLNGIDRYKQTMSAAEFE